MTQHAQAPSGAQPSGRPASTGAPGPAISRQFVNFSFYRLDPAFRRLDENTKLQARSEFLKLFEQKRDGMMCLTYSTVGLRPETDFMLWRIALSTDAFQQQSMAMNMTRVG